MYDAIVAVNGSQEPFATIFSDSDSERERERE
jgi:hypothetical protein